MKIAVIGSINQDLVYDLDRLPKLGETVFGGKYQLMHGGKGANQAMMLHALEPEVLFLGAIGNDLFGEMTKLYYQEHQLAQHLVEKETNSGLAIIQLLDNDNQITIFKGANDLLDVEDVDLFFRQNPDIEIVVCQAEINYKTLRHVIVEANKRNMQVVLNPAPPVSLDDELIQKCTYIIPNELEAKDIFQTEDLNQIIRTYPKKVIITLGEEGAMYFDKQIIKIPAMNIDVLDTTGAGDAFIAGFTSGIANQKSLKEAVEKGIKTAAITCIYLGAQSAYDNIKNIMD